MLDLIKLRKQHGFQAVPDIINAKVINTYKGFPIIDEAECIDRCDLCKNVCPSGAIVLSPFNLDLGKCIFCGECERVCPEKVIKFTSEHRLGCSERENLCISSKESFEEFNTKAIESNKFIKNIFGSSLKLRQVSAGGCNGCEAELSACSNVNFDMGRFGIDFVASPRHADGLVITGPVTKNMSAALYDAYQSISEPKIVIAVGACAVSGGLFAQSGEIDRKFFDDIHIDLYVPGCPPHPLTFINAVLRFLGRG